ncbi:hypothetical protein PAHAL_4G291500 [Panicum hallii]|jgi:hypothetical protein|uniref:Uncharacterized protein n=1 Tax=Panicum hallii TaxID=206008 RepID=A0A2S3HKY9_9POAL|nr:uncharacterized protein LOC112890703 [Panicum hallii]XP_025813338.1 uncharacterized protein LOC112890703 [Panicum hallii]XP_025813339.1 uncharacterized protein LOC112890703 [Panicum hallii]XP_025813340.1 uncharacterized protein LOC112890703 [Panicum hallii]PAN25306.1 hypothetical protein PAHAL_4G291500 [Panicum hallii]
MASVAAAGEFALAVALGCAYILAPILDSLEGISPRSAALDAAVAAALVTLPVTYLLGVVLVYLHVTPAPPVAPGAARRLAALLACAAASASLGAFMSLSLSGAGGSPPGCGQ